MARKVDVTIYDDGFPIDVEVLGRVILSTGQVIELTKEEWIELAAKLTLGKPKES